MDKVEQGEDRGGPTQPLVSTRQLTKHFPLRRRFLGRQEVVKAVDDLNLDLIKGETLAIVGESGCGKSTTSRLLMGLIAPTAGQVIFDGELVGSAAAAPIRAVSESVSLRLGQPGPAHGAGAVCGQQVGARAARSLRPTGELGEFFKDPAVAVNQRREPGVDRARQGDAIFDGPEDADRQVHVVLG